VILILPQKRLTRKINLPLRFPVIIISNLIRLNYALKSFNAQAVTLTFLRQNTTFIDFFYIEKGPSDKLYRTDPLI